MKDRLFQLLGIEHGEESMVSMLLLQSVFLGIFYGAFDISAHSLFLAIFDEKMMAKGYVVSGIAGIILTSLYTWLQVRLKFRNFAIINLIFVTIITLILWIVLLTNPVNWVIFLVFIMLGPLNILAILGFWGTTGRLFTLRQGKRLFGLVDAGLIIGIIVSCYTIPVLLSFNFRTHNILLISSTSILVAAIIQIMIGQRFHFAAGSSEKQVKKKPGLSIFREDSYIRIMGLFIALSVVTAFFVQYSFMAVTREQYPAEDDMARFLGLFTGSMMIFTLLIKVLVFSYLIKNYGLRTCLAISPLLIAGFTAIAVGIGMLQGYTPASGGFLLFFLLLALSRLISKSLKDSIESPSFKVIYQTVDEKIRFEVQSGIDGTINEIAALSSGLILAGLGALAFVKLIHFSLVLFFIIIIWIFVALRLYTEYRKSIRKALETTRQKDTDSENSEDWGNLKNKFYGKRLFKSNYFNLITGNTSAINNYNNKWFLKQIIDFSAERQDINLLPALKMISGNPAMDESLRQISAEIIENFEETNSNNPKKINSLSSPPEDEKILKARKILSSTRMPQTTEILRLLRDNSVESKRIAIYLIGKFRLKDMLPEVCNCLNIRGLEADAKSVLHNFQSEACDELARFYLVSSGNLNTSKTILHLMGTLNTKESKDFLYSRLWMNSRQLKEIAIRFLNEYDYNTSPEEKDRLHQLISEIIGLLTWNIAANVCLEKNNDTFLLKEMKKETSKWNAFLFNVLSITYDSGSIAKIRENLENGTVESVNYALEMIDIVIDDSIKPKLISLLDVVSDEEKLKNLHQFYPGEIPRYEQLIEDIINRDYNLIGLWTKACTLRKITGIKEENLAESLVALLFSPEGILQEEAAKSIARSKKELYLPVSERLDAETKNKLDKIISGEADENELLYEKVGFLSGCFPGIPEDELLFLAGAMKYMRSLQREYLSPGVSFISWNFVSDKSNPEVLIFYGEEEEEKAAKLLSSDNNYFYLLPLRVIEEFHDMFPDRSFEIYKYIDNFEN